MATLRKRRTMRRKASGGRRRVMRHGGGGRKRRVVVRQRSLEGDAFKQGTGTSMKTFRQLKSFREGKLNKPMIVWIYADWCGHCHQFLSTWRSMVMNMRDVTFVTMDGSSGSLTSDMAGYPQISGYPTIWLFSGKSTVPVVYRGERRSEPIKRALEKMN
jgi:thiol-disulfide isomerase/thioredoxin